MFISEIFYSIQGEGNFAGTPAIFVRTGKCNLQCTWCDTKYTWHPDFSDYKEWSIKKVVQEVENLAKDKDCKHLVVTGGEPMLQQDGIVEIRRSFPGFFMEMETNGSVPNKMGEGVINQFNISPKLSNSGNRPYKIALRADNAIYKFVVDQPSDLKEVEDYVAANDLPREKVYLMPQGATREELEKKNDWVEESARERGLGFSPRLHIMEWGGKRGT